MELVPWSDDRMPASRGVKLTYDDFVLFPDDGKRHELIDGEHYVTPSPDLKHQRVSGNLYLLIASWLEDRRIGQIFYAPFDVVFSLFDVVEPDLLYMSNEAGDVLTTAAAARSRAGSGSNISAAAAVAPRAFRRL
jgi:Uma2 family endonuclease